MDCLFVLSAAAAEEFVGFPVNMDGRSLEFPTCGGGNNLDTEHPLFRGALPAALQHPLKIPWRIQINQTQISHVWGGLVRSQRTLRVPTDIDWGRLKRPIWSRSARSSGVQARPRTRDPFRCTTTRLERATSLEVRAPSQCVAV